MKKSPKSLVIAIIIVLAVGGGAFYGGMKYGQSRVNVSGMGHFGAAGPRNGSRTGNNSGMSFAGGQIIAQDSQSITVKLQNGGSEIVFLTAATEIGKSVTGSTTDLAIGKNVSVTGKINPDGSIAAQSIQIRPEGIMAPAR